MTHLRRVHVWRTAARLTLLLSTVLAVVLAVKVWKVVQSPEAPHGAPLIVDDVSRLNPVRVAEILTPTTTEEIVDAVKRHGGPISIGGARHSMGGQIAAHGGLHLDMRRFNRILDVSIDRKVATVQAGATWRQLQEHIDAANLSVMVMQSYASFTVGGSLSVNGHGRYVGLGPLIHSVMSLTVVLADGSLVEASRTKHEDVFKGVIGGYGGLGVIVEATLQLTDNVRVKRHTELLPVAEYRRYFVDRVRGRSSIVFHSANIFPDAYNELRVVTLAQTSDRVTVEDRLIPIPQTYRLNRFAFWVQAEWPFGRAIQRRIFDSIYFRGEPVTWRNYEASRDVAELEPASRVVSTYVLQEYFVPVERFDAFVACMRDVFRRRGVRVVNVSVRHSAADRESLLAWARTDVFAFVIYYQQGTSQPATDAVGLWTRALIDGALDSGGTYYLPYQLNATVEQFRRAYPRAADYFALKQRVDPTNKFRNTLIDRYQPMPASPQRSTD